MRFRSALCGMLLAICTGAFGQNAALTIGGIPPSEQGGADFLDHYRRATVSIGQVVDDGGKQKYVTIGSGVLVTDTKHIGLITAKHVVFDPKIGYVPSIMYIRVPHGEIASASDLGIKVPLVENGRNLWSSLPDESDIAIVPIPPLSKYGKIHAIDINSFGGGNDLFQGAGVAVLGYPQVIGESYLTTPLARAGIVSWIDPDGPMSKRFLIDANIVGGNSGGPVFHIRNGATRNGGIAVGGGAAFIGIVVQGSFEQVGVKTKKVPQLTITDINTGEISPMITGMINSGGIGVVEPAEKVRKLAISTFGTN